MAHKFWVVAFSFIVAASPLSAASPQPSEARLAPAGSANARYCLRLLPATGSLIETIQCWTRAEWAEQDVDVDKEWAKDGVSVIEA